MERILWQVFRQTGTGSEMEAAFEIQPHTEQRLHLLENIMLDFNWRCIE